MDRKEYRKQQVAPPAKKPVLEQIYDEINGGRVKVYE